MTQLTSEAPPGGGALREGEAGIAAPPPPTSSVDTVHRVRPAPHDKGAASTTLLSLQQCIQRLRHPKDLGQNAPAYVTLKRWSASGALDRAVHRSPGKRPMYDLARVRTICLENLADRFAPLEPSGVEAAGSRAPAGQASRVGAPDAASASLLQAVSDVSDRVAELEHSIGTLRSEVSTALQGLTQQVARAGAAMEGLEAARKGLMLRTDGELTALKSQVATLKEQLIKVGQTPAGTAAGASGRLWGSGT